MPNESPRRLGILSRDASDYARILTRLQLPRLDILWATDDPLQVPLDQVEILLADPDLAIQVVGKCPALVWCQSTWAGNKPLLSAPRQDYILTGVKGIFGHLMREYVFAHLLNHTRQIAAFAYRQANREWSHPDLSALSGRTLGILGAGSIAASLLAPASAFGMRVVGFNRSGRAQQGYDRIYSANEVSAFARACDFVVNLLPDTADTVGILNDAFFTALPQGALLINAGRGSAVDDAALIRALDDGTLAHAVLDVFMQEPLPQHHPFWSHPGITMTMHTAAMSAPADVAAVFTDNLARLQAGEPLLYVFDFNKGY